MKGPRKSRGSSSHVRFLGSSSAPSHRGWYGAIAGHYDALYDPKRNAKAAEFLDRAFRRQGGVADVLDPACGTFRIGMGLLRKGYGVVGRDLSPDMVRVARRALERARMTADVRVADLRALRLDREFDAVVCVGTAFNYLVEPRDVRLAMTAFRRHLRRGGFLVLDLTNFDAWIDHPTNARAEVDVRARDGTRIAIYGFNEQSPAKMLHYARLLTVLQRGHRIDVRFDEAPLKIWDKEALARSLRSHGFRVVEWWGDLAVGARYRRRSSPRLVAVAKRL